MACGCANHSRRAFQPREGETPAQADTLLLIQPAQPARCSVELIGPDTANHSQLFTLNGIGNCFKKANLALLACYGRWRENQPRGTQDSEQPIPSALGVGSSPAQDEEQVPENSKAFSA